MFDRQRTKHVVVGAELDAGRIFPCRVGAALTPEDPGPAVVAIVSLMSETTVGFLGRLVWRQLMERELMVTYQRPSVLQVSLKMVLQHMLCPPDESGFWHGW